MTAVHKSMLGAAALILITAVLNPSLQDFKEGAPTPGQLAKEYPIENGIEVTGIGREIAFRRESNFLLWSIYSMEYVVEIGNGFSVRSAERTYVGLLKNFYELRSKEGKIPTKEPVTDRMGILDKMGLAQSFADTAAAPSEGWAALGRRIKVRYPEYAHLSDEDLGVVAKNTYSAAEIDVMLSGQ